MFDKCCICCQFDNDNVGRRATLMVYCNSEFPRIKFIKNVVNKMCTCKTDTDRGYLIRN